jgi:3-hydroxyisobutyrate dehydrogenase-like beta-hydroxyacid dehydrogenase
MSALGFVGLGARGAPVVGRPLSQGHTVYGTKRTRSKAAALVEQGLLWCDSPREVAHAADVVFSMVTDDAALDALTKLAININLAVQMLAFSEGVPLAGRDRP